MRSYRTSSNYTSNSYNAGISSSPQKTTTSNTGNNDRESGAATNRTQKVSAEAKTKVAKDIAKDNATAFNNLRYTQSNTLLGKIANTFGIGEKSFNANKSYYEKNVVGKNNFTRSVDSYKDYMKKRGSGEIDSMGRTKRTGSGRGDIQPGITKNIGGRTIQTTAPTEAEVSQSEAANADAAALKVKKRGRSASIMTSSQGVTKMAADYSLGKKSLLGRV